MVMALLAGSAIVAVAASQAPRVSLASSVDGKQYALLPYVLSASRQSYEKVCGPFYRSEVLGKGNENELVGFRFSRDGKIEDPVVRVHNLSVMIDDSIVSPTAQEVSEIDGGHYVLRMGQRDYNTYASAGCLTGVSQMK
jgi:hypothetical protein